jgi:Zn-dependent peptidase ImmA (M78 family)
MPNQYKTLMPKDEFRRFYEAGVTQRAIAHHYGTSIKAVANKARRMGFDPRPMGMKPQEVHVPTVEEVLYAEADN